MQLVDNLRQKPLVQKVEKFFPAIAFLAGFSWDSITLGQQIDQSDLLFLLAYYIGAFILVILLSAHLEHPEGWTKERLQAAKMATPVKEESKVPEKTDAVEAPATAQTEAPEQVPSQNPASTSKISAVAGKMANFAKPATTVVASKIKNVADASATKLKNAADASTAEAKKLADKIGYESTAIPKNAIVVEHRFLDREWSEVWKDRFSWMVQFCFGSMFSALVVCYFKSSGSLASFLLVLFLAVLLVGNEFLKKRYESFGVSLAFFCLLGTMFLNFAIPHLVHRIGFIWFFLSTLASFGICVGIQKLSHHKRRVLIAPALISSALVIAYIMNWVPPVPLVLKQQLVCQNFDKKNYSCDIDKPTFLQTLGFKLPSVHRIDGAEVYYLSSVYAPAELKAELEYRWYVKDEATGEYRLTDRVSSGRMVMRGGRENGYRSYTKKKKIPAGRYLVETAYKNGAVIGSQKFEVFEDGPAPKGFERDSLR
ncbi:MULTISPECIES: DUF2914 domain-containing protein [unclassified Fibrobacter]|uniref:DUF2914 domain-containing protein n=1 Tax=unclassified Fibrobacter TaxID=2634177 RepID=UPI0025C256E7|nr:MULTISPECIES: DUF2914 domain-containing protein [unclassified Fibrobacter]